MTDAVWMRAALAEAEKSFATHDQPVGAVVVFENEIVGSGHWTFRHDGLLDHAELVALRAANADPRLVRRRREQTLYTTLEPCLLCMGGAMSCLVGRVVYALEAPLDGAADVAERWAPRLGHPSGPSVYAVPEVAGGVERDAAIEQMRRWVEQNPDVPWASAYVPASEGTR